MSSDPASTRSRTRRFRALCKSFAESLGDDLNEAERSLVEAAALARMRLDELRFATLRGEPTDDAVATRLLNSLHRLVGAVVSKGGKRRKHDGASDLRRYLESKGAR
jgi:hypothetical protein